MADETVTPEVGGSATAAPPTLQDAARKQTEALYDVLALIDAVAGRIDDIRSPEAADELHSTYRLAQMAHQRVSAVIDAIDPYI